MVVLCGNSARPLDPPALCEGPHAIQLQALKIGFYLYKGAKSSLFTFAITVLFCASVGITFAEFLILDSIYFVTKSVTDVPTGMLADYYDRRKLLMLSCVIGAISFWLIAVMPKFWSIAVAEVLYGLSQSLSSGADSAYVFAGLSAYGRQQDYGHVESVGRGAATGAFALASIGGALVGAWYGYTIVYWITGFAILAGAPALLLAPSIGVQARAQRQKLNVFTLQLIRTFVNSRILLFVVGCFVLLFVTVRVGTWSFQSVMGVAGVGTGWYGVLASVLLLLSAAVSFGMRNIDTSLTIRNLAFLFVPTGVFLLGVAISAGMHSALSGVLMIVMFIPYAIAHGSFNQLLLTWLNNHVGDINRASALSVMSAVGSLGYSLTAPLFGMSVDSFGIGLTFALTGGAYVVLALILCAVCSTTAAVVRPPEAAGRERPSRRKSSNQPDGP